MSWQTDDGEHEGWVAPTFADGAYSTGGNGQGLVVSRIGTKVLEYDEWQTRPESEVIGWTTLCECGWRGQMWTRAASPAEVLADPGARLAYCADAWADDLDDLGHAEWKEHIAPVLALAEVSDLALRKIEIDRLLDAALAKAKAAGASESDVARALRGW